MLCEKYASAYLAHHAARMRVCIWVGWSHSCAGGGEANTPALWMRFYCDLWNSRLDWIRIQRERNIRPSESQIYTLHCIVFVQMTGNGEATLPFGLTLRSVPFFVLRVKRERKLMLNSHSVRKSLRRQHTYWMLRIRIRFINNIMRWCSMHNCCILFYIECTSNSPVPNIYVVDGEQPTPWLGIFPGNSSSNVHKRIALQNNWISAYMFEFGWGVCSYNGFCAGVAHAGLR